MVLPLLGGLLGPLLLGGTMSPILAGALGSGIGAFAQTGDPEDALSAGLTGILGGSLLGGMVGGAGGAAGAAPSGGILSQLFGGQLAGQAAGQAAGQSATAALNGSAAIPATANLATNAATSAATNAATGAYTPGGIGKMLGVTENSSPFMQRAFSQQMMPGYLAGLAGASAVPPKEEEDEGDYSQAPSPGGAARNAPVGDGMRETDYGFPTNYPTPGTVLGAGAQSGAVGSGIAGLPGGALPQFQANAAQSSAIQPNMSREEILRRMGIRGFAEGGAIPARPGPLPAPQSGISTLPGPLSGDPMMTKFFNQLSAPRPTLDPNYRAPPRLLWEPTPYDPPPPPPPVDPTPPTDPTTPPWLQPTSQPDGTGFGGTQPTAGGSTTTTLPPFLGGSTPTAAAPVTSVSSQPQPSAPVIPAPAPFLPPAQVSPQPPAPVIPSPDPFPPPAQVSPPPAQVSPQLPPWATAPAPAPASNMPPWYTGFAEGGAIDGAGQSDGMPENEAVIRDATAALAGQHPNPEIALGAFVAKFGEEALQMLMDRVSGTVEDMAGTGGMVPSGPGRDGMSDDVLASTSSGERVALSGDEFVIPGDVVSDLGNGSSDAGAEALYDLMDRVRATRRGTTAQPPRINPQDVLPA